MTLYVERWETKCEVPDDPGEVVRGARPLTEADRNALREQHIARLIEQAAREQTS